MHCYIDAERFEGATLDEALRWLLAGFRCAGLSAVGELVPLAPFMALVASHPPLTQKLSLPH